jgi:hypothetical protein
MKKLLGAETDLVVALCYLMRNGLTRGEALRGMMTASG